MRRVDPKLVQVLPRRQLAPPAGSRRGDNNGWRAYVRYSVGVGAQHLEWVKFSHSATISS